jgi:hypothetical protein
VTDDVSGMDPAAVIDEVTAIEMEEYPGGQASVTELLERHESAG